MSGIQHNIARYLPPLDVVWSRAECLRWMRDMEWSSDFIDRCMYHDLPDEQTIRRLVYTHGPEMAYEMLRRDYAGEMVSIYFDE